MCAGEKKTASVGGVGGVGCGYGWASLFFWAIATGDVFGTRVLDPHALHVLWRELMRHRL